MQQNSYDYDMCIIGAGPAGMMAAIAAEKEGLSVCLLEKNTNPGRKLLVTGGGRCNLTHAGSIDDFVRDCQPYGNTLKPAFYALSPQQTLAFFHERGLETYIDEDGCVFPVSERANDVCKILVEEIQQCGVQIRYDQQVRAVEKSEQGFIVVTDKGHLVCRVLIVATGGKSWPQTGSTGDGYEIAKGFGHTIIPQVGILCPMVAREDWVAGLQGISLPNVAIRMKIKSKAKLFFGEMVFTADGIGGPVVFDVSRSAVELLDDQKTVPVMIDFCPDMSREQRNDLLIQRCASNPKKEVASLLCEWFPRRLSAHLQCCSSGDKPVLACALLKKQRQQLVEAIKAMPLTLIRSGVLEKATVTRGGIRRQEIDSKTMQSRLCDGLFFAGEVIDVDGPCGGYNLQIAFSTGFLAGKSAVRFLRGQ